MVHREDTLWALRSEARCIMQSYLGHLRSILRVLKDRGRRRGAGTVHAIEG